MKQVQSSCLGCSLVLITLGVLGLLSTVVNLGNSNRAILVMFFTLANSFGSVTKFSIITIGAGLLFIMVIALINEMSKGKVEEDGKR